MLCTLQEICRERSEKKPLGKRLHTETFPCDQMTSPEGRQKRRKTVDIRDSIKKQCIICKQINRKFDFESKMEIELITKTILTKALCIHAASCTKYHKKCMDSYLSKFKRDGQILLDADKGNDNYLSTNNDLQKSVLNNIGSGNAWLRSN